MTVALSKAFTKTHFEYVLTELMFGENVSLCVMEAICICNIFSTSDTEVCLVQMKHTHLFFFLFKSELN